LDVQNKKNTETDGHKYWTRLDNAAKIFPVISNKVRTMVFRLTVELHERVKVKELQQALTQTLEEYPYFRSQLKKGFFWYWLEHSESSPMIQPDEGPPCRSFKMVHRNHLLLRILAKNNQISAEFMHILCDGAGGLKFLMSLVRNYGELCGWDLDPARHPIKDDKATHEELWEDSYQKYFEKNLPKPSSLSKAYHLPFEVAGNPALRVFAVQMETGAALSVSKKYGVTLTEYLASVYLFILQGFYLKENPPGSKRKKRNIIRIELPVNLRNLFPSKSLRNFALFIMPEIDPSLGAYSFEEITRVVHHYMQLETDPRQIKRIIRRNVGSERNLMVRAIPLFLKVPVLKIAYKSFGPPLYSGILTNVGKVDLSPGCSDYIKRFRFIAPPPDPKLKVCSALISFQDKMVLTFGNHSLSNQFEKGVISFLRKEGLTLTLLNN
jgi:hypothetical protein